MEVCVDSIESAINAVKGGASRLELCMALSEGGLTPTPGFLAILRRLVKIPVFAILRPRGGGDFVYSEQEVEVMRQDACYMKDAGAAGIVFGALDNNGKVNEEVCKRILEIVTPLPVTFHRAFDVTSDPFEALETLIKLGFKRILTSGQESSAEKGVELIKQLVQHSKGRIEIMPGGGITKDNIEKILSVTGAKEFHASARFPKKLSLKNTKLQMGSVDDSRIYVTDESLVKEIIKIAKTLIPVPDYREIMKNAASKRSVTENSEAKKTMKNATAKRSVTDNSEVKEIMKNAKSQISASDDSEVKEIMMKATSKKSGSDDSEVKEIMIKATSKRSGSDNSEVKEIMKNDTSKRSGSDDSKVKEIMKNDTSKRSGSDDSEVKEIIKNDTSKRSGSDDREVKEIIKKATSKRSGSDDNEVKEIIKKAKSKTCGSDDSEIEEIIE